MVRLTRAQQQARTRDAVVAAARQEFIEHGYGAAKVDRIAERAELTRGAVYSNFSGKRALYLAVLVDLVDRAAGDVAVERPGTVAEALGAFARVWLERLPLAHDVDAGGRLQLRSLAGIVEDDAGRAVLAQLARLEALLLALGLESCADDGARRVRLAELALTMLGGSSLLAELTPGFGDPFDRSRACAHLAGLDLADNWAPPHLAYVTPATPVHQDWAPPAQLLDQISGTPADLTADGVVVVLGAQRLGAVEEAVRSGEPVTVVVVTSDPAELGQLVRLRVRDALSCLGSVFPLRTWERLRLVIDDAAQVAAAVGVSDATDTTEVAVRIHAGAVVARAEGHGAAHAVATGQAVRVD
ncbi:TetR/AcrR family transcriptional regulator [Prauserella cavernicola]|uniref:TetR/AcrR family transcriptional regulator n=1 Tax=Prauserella cavernicola TaxID=2800127 RepID=A0A934V2L2_9PSEU|nr:TetR/AcrR family transcriptional regulator [Prauserella cavernicola]MBK1786026.1 TetR/AcrR family transcriptional regulator [Prauserella cavernicola]